MDRVGPGRPFSPCLSAILAGEGQLADFPHLIQVEPVMRVPDVPFHVEPDPGLRVSRRELQRPPVVQEAAPDVIVMDVIMPEIDGIEACRQITELLPGTRVLMLTASNEQDAIVRAIAAGATGYLQKYSGKE